MTVLVADVGGTNTRLALVSTRGPDHVERIENDRFDSFYDALGHYVSGREMPPLAGACVAVAGPVTGTHASLTNRNWSFDVDRLQAALPGVGRAMLVNDLVALGYALPVLRPEQVQDLRPAGVIPPNDQALVAGLGTGFNVCLIKGDCVMESELGHGSLPASVAWVLRHEVGAAADRFGTNEELFSGRGLARLFHALSGEERAGPEILARFDDGSCDDARRTVRLMAKLLGTMSREMIFQYLPFGGIHFAGGAARGILGSSALTDFLAALDHDGKFADHVELVPIRLIRDDAAALVGAARIAQGVA